MSRAIVVGLLGGMLCCGCTTLSGGIAPSSEPIAPKSYEVVAPVSGTSWGVSLLWIIPLSQASTASALNEARHQVRCDALVRVTVDNMRCFLVPLFALERIKVEGVAVKSKP